ncbi:MAG: trypsin-like peptidase domain-containing protein [Phycisphaerales bacterium]|nr:trypsin-like peptidase domain-containing protein [Phycisphaerales bacterium]
MNHESTANSSSCERTGRIDRFCRSAGRFGGLIALAVAITAAPSLAQSEADPRPHFDFDRRTPVVQVFDACRDAVVNISTTRMRRVMHYDSPLEEFFNIPRLQNQRFTSIGSGAVIHESGYIVTNAHVVAQASDVQVSFANNRKLDATVVAVDSDHDLAVLKVRDNNPLRAVRLGKSDDVLVGESVIAIGNPLGFQHTCTTGIISATHRTLTFPNGVEYEGLIQTDASINPGNSGGPLLNINAELIGINSAIRGDAQNIGFAIPVARLWELLPAMLDIEQLSGSKRIRLGVDVRGPELEVKSVRKDSPADKAGLRAGDRVRRFDKRALRDSIDFYVNLIDRQPGDTFALDVLRGDQHVKVDVTLESAPLPNGRQLASKLLGLSLEEMSKASDENGETGLFVRRVEPGSPAAAAKIRAGDLLFGLDLRRVSKLDEVGLALESVNAGDRVVVDVLRVTDDAQFHMRRELMVRSGR